MYDVTVEKDVEMATRDGVILRADVYRPVSDETFPCLICRTPYDKSTPLNGGFAAEIASRGYIAVTQDIRGSHRSDGDLVWQFKKGAEDLEARDGNDCVDWAAGLKGCDGRVGTFGVSYSSYLSWLLQFDKHPALSAVSTSGMVSSIRDMNFGIFETGRRLQWTYSQAAGLRARAGDHRYPATLMQGNEDWLVNLRGKWLWTLPLTDIPDHVFGQLTDDLRTYMKEQTEEFWPLDRGHANADVPVCVQTGWWDRFSLSVSHYEGLVRDGPPEMADKHRLVIGPWPHLPFSLNGRIGPTDYGPEADTTYPDFIVDWYDHHFKGRRTDLACGDPVQLFILNENKWRGFPSWPPPGAVETPFYLDSDGDARTPAGSGRLQGEQPTATAADTYVYDPADPVMSLMGADSQMAPVDQRPNERRTDILVYQTPPLKRDLVLIGPVTLDLWASSDGPDTDFCAKLIEVAPDGGPILNISTGIMRARYRDGYDSPSLMQPGQPYLFQIKMLPVGIRLRKGSRLRIDITSSDFPAFDRNHNTGADFWSDGDLRVARQTVFHDTAHPSRILLPVMPD